MHADTALQCRAKPIAVISHPRSGTHLTIDGLRHFFVETHRRQRPRQPVHDLYINLDRLHPDHPYAARESRFRTELAECDQRMIIKTHCSTALEQVSTEHQPFARALLDASDIVYVVRDVRPVLASYMALRPLKDADSPSDMHAFLRTNLDVEMPPATAWAEHVKGWIAWPGVHVVKFEDLMDDYAGTVRRLGTNLGMTRRDEAGSIRIYPKPKSIFENRARRWLGRQRSSSIDNLRMKIKTPKWRAAMSSEDLELIRTQAGDVMKQLGYTWD